MLNAGCSHHSTSPPEPVATVQQQTDVDNNSHIPPAQKAAIQQQMAAESHIKAEPTPTSNH
jgi:hypothetical protein